MGIIVALFASCKKESVDEINPNGDASIQKQIQGISQVPASFTKKAFIESFTGSSYNKCPESDALVESMINSNLGRVYAASIHEGDQMETGLSQFINSRFNNGSVPPVPSFMISRVSIANQVFLTSQQMQGFTNKSFNMPAKCGLAIKSWVVGRKAYITVHAGFNQVLSGSHNLTVYLVENNVSNIGKGYDQLNTYNYVPSSAFYNLGDPIINYVHQHVLRMVLTEELGNPIAPINLAPAGHEIQNFQVDIPTTIDMNQVYIIAFVNRPGSNALTHEVLNVQQTKLGTLKNWD